MKLKREEREFGRFGCSLAFRISNKTRIWKLALEWSKQGEYDVAGAIPGKQCVVAFFSLQCVCRFSSGSYASFTSVEFPRM